MTWCDGCNRPHPQTTPHITSPDPDSGLCHIEYLCTPCYQVDATYWDSIEPKTPGRAA
jgi:hypothetical protein